MEYFDIYVHNSGDRSVGIQPTCHTIQLETWFANMLKDEELMGSFKQELCDLFTKYDGEFGYSADDEESVLYEGLCEEFINYPTDTLKIMINNYEEKKKLGNALTTKERVTLQVCKQELESRK